STETLSQPISQNLTANVSCSSTPNTHHPTPNNPTPNTHQNPFPLLHNSQESCKFAGNKSLITSCQNL
ncbi:hypothetical protein, partial [Prevotella jejuni]|uniref:hypothetical protein n=1 Tax=Prevotella jejuni TaxID=1177574 RepID=UPI0028DCB480